MSTRHKKNLSNACFYFMVIMFFTISPIWPEITNEKTDNNKVDPAPNSLPLNLTLDFGGEIYFFSADDLSSENVEDFKLGNTQNVTYNYANRQKIIKYTFEPVVMTRFELSGNYHFLYFNTHYKTDRIYHRGGSIESGPEVAAKLSKNETVSEIIKLGLGFFGIETSFRAVQFDFGRLDVLNAATNAPLDSGNLKLNILEADLRYNFNFIKNPDKSNLLRFFINYKYLDYALPRIIYEFQDKDGSTSVDNYEINRESEPQVVRTKSHILGFGIENPGLELNKNWQIPFEFGMHLGGGEADFVIGGERKNPAIINYIFKVKAGLAFHLPESSHHWKFHILYELNTIFSILPDSGSLSKIFTTDKSTNDYGATIYSFGAYDLYHGIQFAVQGQF